MSERDLVTGLLVLTALVTGYFVGGIAAGMHLARCCYCRRDFLAKWQITHEGPCHVVRHQHVNHPKPEDEGPLGHV